MEDEAIDDEAIEDETFYRPLLNRDRLVHILDPEPATCEALSVLFRLEGFQTAFSVDVGGFLSAIDRRQPDIVVLNQQVGDTDGLAILRTVKTLRTGTPVFVIQNEPEVGRAVLAMKAGAEDVVTKPIDAEHLLAAVREILHQNVHVGAVDDGRRVVEVRGFSTLTPREREVLQLITNGQSNKEAGRLLGISPRTIEVHRARVMEKLGARNTADLLRIVLTS